MTENLNILTAESWCYNDSPDSCAKYGRLYTWAAAKTACPSGWHLPTREEWQSLVDSAGGDAVAGKKLKAGSGWNDYWGRSGNGTDEYGFSALPGGDLPGGGYFNPVVGDFGYWWTATETGGDNAYIREMAYGGSYVGDYYRCECSAYSVRCVAD